MVEEKGLAPDSADKIGGFVNGNAGGAKELWAKLTEENKFGDHPVRFVTLLPERVRDGRFPRLKLSIVYTTVVKDLSFGFLRTYINLIHFARVHEGWPFFSRQVVDRTSSLFGFPFVPTRPPRSYFQKGGLYLVLLCVFWGSVASRIPGDHPDSEWSPPNQGGY